MIIDWESFKKQKIALLPIGVWIRSGNTYGYCTGWGIAGLSACRDIVILHDEAVLERDRDLDSRDWGFPQSPRERED